ncbi:hypothetical protein B5G09_03960 [Alistipes sp. An54]|nr:hypothetical protein B5G09_03960 [Alistipes sp. An54]
MASIFPKSMLVVLRILFGKDLLVNWRLLLNLLMRMLSQRLQPLKLQYQPRNVWLYLKGSTKKYYSILQ